MDCEPSELTFYTAMINLPWSFKILYGLISDNVPIFGLKRKPYLLFWSAAQFVVLMILFFVAEDGGAALTVILLATASLGQAFSNVVIDAVLIV